MAYKKNSKAKEVEEPIVDLEETVDKETIEDEVVEKVQRHEPIVPTFKDNDYILCHSIIAGGLNINCRSQNVYEFDSYGSTCEIQYRDLVELVRKHSDHIFVPRIIIDNDDFIKEFPQLKKLYENLYTVNDLNDILRLPTDKMKAEINKLPESLFDTLRNLASTMIANGEIDSVSKIRNLSEIFKADFSLVSELFQNAE